MKTEALKLADWLESKSKLGWPDNFGHELNDASDMIRKLVEEKDRITRDLIGASLYEHDYKTLIEKLKPLSDEEILAISNTMPYANRFEFARAIEERHGIK